MYYTCSEDYKTQWQMFWQISGTEKKQYELLANLFYQTTCWASPNYHHICLAVDFLLYTWMKPITYRVWISSWHFGNAYTKKTWSPDFDPFITEVRCYRTEVYWGDSLVNCNDVGEKMCLLGWISMELLSVYSTQKNYTHNITCYFSHGVMMLVNNRLTCLLLYFHEFSIS